MGQKYRVPTKPYPVKGTNRPSHLRSPGLYFLTHSPSEESFEAPWGVFVYKGKVLEAARGVFLLGFNPEKMNLEQKGGI